MRPALVRHREAEGMSSHGMDEFTVQRASIGLRSAQAASPSAESRREARAPACGGRGLPKDTVTG